MYQMNSHLRVLLSEDWRQLSLTTKRSSSTVEVFSSGGGNKIKMRLGPWYLQKDNAITRAAVGSAVELLDCDEKQEEHIKPQPFCKCLPFFSFLQSTPSPEEKLAVM